MTLRIPVLLLLALAAVEARADCDRDADCKGGKVCVANKCVERKYCVRDKDCPGDQVCDRNACTSPGGTAPAPATGGTWRGSSREQLASQNAGMALLYTKNTWPMNIVDRPLVVAPGLTEAQLAINKDISADLTGGAGGQLHPLEAGIYARFGVSDRIHAGLDALTLCITDCGTVGAFRTLSLGAGYAVIADHDMNLVPALTMSFNNVGTASGNSLVVALSPGFLFGWRLSSAMQLFGSGGFLFSFIGRDNAANPDLFALHVEPRLQLATGFSIAPYIGYTLSIQHTDFYLVPLGVIVLFTPAREFDVGASFELNDIAAKVAPGATDLRSFTLFGTIRI